MNSRTPKTETSAGEQALLPVDEAWRLMTASLKALDANESVPLDEALGRVLAAPVMSSVDVPGHDNSAVDGYALNGAVLEQAAATRAKPPPLRVVGKTLAGEPFDGDCGAGECVRIMTGAVMPAGADTVVMQEDVRVEGERVHLTVAGQRRGQNVRLRGEDIAAHSVVARTGTRLLPAHLGMLASLGLRSVCASRALRVGIVSTGNELREPGEAIEAGAVYDSNRFTLAAMLRRMQIEPVDLGIVRDDPQALRATLTRAAAELDAIITSGGASTGEADYVQPLLAELGEVGFWRIATRPGRPLAFGHVRKAAFFGLPGNPVAVIVTFVQFVAPALRRLMGEQDAVPPPRLRARLAAPLRKKPARLEFYRAVVQQNAHGEAQVRQYGRPGSALLHTVTEANCFIVLDHDAPAPAVGDWVDVQPFFGLF